MYLILGRRALGLTFPWCLLPVIIASRVALILSDVIVLCFTWTVTHAYRSRDILRGFGRTTTLAEVLYQNGAFAPRVRARVHSKTDMYWAGAIYFL